MADEESSTRRSIVSGIIQSLALVAEPTSRENWSRSVDCPSWLEVLPGMLSGEGILSPAREDKKPIVEVSTMINVWKRASLYKVEKLMYFLLAKPYL